MATSAPVGTVMTTGDLLPSGIKLRVQHGQFSN